MKIIILGAGQVGSTLAEHLVQEDNDITIVDSDVDALASLQSRLDIQTIAGPASHPGILKQAGAEDADMLIAVTDSDETNMVACQVAYTIYNTPTKIARMRASDYLEHDELYNNKALPIDHWICPEKLVTTSVTRMIDFPGSLQVLDFANKKVQLVAVKASRGGSLIGKSLGDIHSHLSEADIYVAAISRAGKSIELNDSVEFYLDDEIFFIAATQHVEMIMSAFGQTETRFKKIMIAGGGNIGYNLASTLEKEYQVKIIDHNTNRTERIAKALQNTTVLLGDASDKRLLLNEHIEEIDVFIAVTNDDEANIMSALLAKQLGAREVMALINRTAYADLITGRDIDIAISPQLITIGSILTHIRRGDIVNVYSLRHGTAEAIEVIIHGDEKTTNTVGRTVKELKVPHAAKIAAIVRNEKVLIAKDNLVIESNDHVIIFLEDMKQIHEVERLFEVDVTYF